MFSVRLFIFASFCFCCVLCEKKTCDLEDEKCLTYSVRRTFVRSISGVPGVETSDPLHQDLITKDFPELNLKLTNADLIGMKNCQVDLVRISTKDMKYNYNIGCPLISIESEYEVKGNLGTKFVEGKGTCKMDHYDYNLLFNGECEKIIGEDGKPHMHIKNHVLEIDAKGKVHYDYKNIFYGDKEKSDDFHKWANENWREVDKLIRQPVMDAFMNKYIKNVAAYLKVVPVENLFYSE